MQLYNISYYIRCIIMLYSHPKVDREVGRPKYQVNILYINVLEVKLHPLTDHSTGLSIVGVTSASRKEPGRFFVRRWGGVSPDMGYMMVSNLIVM